MVRSLSRHTAFSTTDFDMCQRLPIKDKAVSTLHRIVNIEVLHAQDIPVNVELAKIPEQNSQTQ